MGVLQVCALIVLLMLIMIYFIPHDTEIKNTSTTTTNVILLYLELS